MPAGRHACSTPRAGTASRSTPPAAATAPASKCKVQVVDGRRRGLAARPARVHRRRARARAGGWPAWRRPTQDLEVEVPPLTTRPKAATVGVGRQVILRPALQKRYVELTEPTLADQRTDLERLLRRDRRPRADASTCTPLRRLPRVLRAGRLQGHRGDRRRGPDRRRARRHHRRAGYAIAFDLGTTTVVGHPARPRHRHARSRWRRCSTSSSPSAAT